MANEGNINPGQQPPMGQPPVQENVGPVPPQPPLNQPVGGPVQPQANQGAAPQGQPVQPNAQQPNMQQPGQPEVQQAQPQNGVPTNQTPNVQYGQAQVIDNGNTMPPPPTDPNAATKQSIAALVCGILSFCCCGLFAGIPALILGIIGLRNNTPKKGFYIAGVVLGGLSIVWSIIGAILVAAGIIDTSMIVRR